MPNLKGVKPGDILLHTSENRRRDSTVPPKEVTVAKVGTKLIHIPLLESEPTGRTATYRIENGYSNGDTRGGRLWKREDWELEKERPDLEKTLEKKYGVEVWRGTPKSVPVLRKILAVLEESES